MHSAATESRFPTRRPGAFRHDAVFYRGEGGFLPAVLPFVSAAVERDEPVLVAVLPAREQAIRNELGPASKRVEFVDMQSAVLWSSTLTSTVRKTAKLGAVVGRGSGEAYQLGFTGQGIVVVQASEGHPVVTS